MRNSAYLLPMADMHKAHCNVSLNRTRAAADDAASSAASDEDNLEGPGPLARLASATLQKGRSLLQPRRGRRRSTTGNGRGGGGPGAILEADMDGGPANDAAMDAMESARAAKADLDAKVSNFVQDHGHRPARTHSRGEPLTPALSSGSRRTRGSPTSRGARTRRTVGFSSPLSVDDSERPESTSGSNTQGLVMNDTANTGPATPVPQPQTTPEPSSSGPGAPPEPARAISLSQANAALVEAASTQAATGAGPDDEDAGQSLRNAGASMDVQRSGDCPATVEEMLPLKVIQ